MKTGTSNKVTVPATKTHFLPKSIGNITHSTIIFLNFATGYHHYKKQIISVI